MDQEARLDKLEKHAERTEERVGNVFGQLEQQRGAIGTIDAKLGQLIESVTRQSAIPKADPFKMLQGIAYVVTIAMALIVPASGVIVWMIITIGAADQKLTGYRLDAQKERIEWMEHHTWRNTSSQAKSASGAPRPMQP